MASGTARLVSVVVPIYKVENYLEKCVNSILKQRYKNIEIILVNDGSPDNCGALCDRYAQFDSRIRVIHKRNGGLSAARNAGIRVSGGDYLMFIDSDDWVDSDFCEAAVYDIERNAADMVVFGYNKVSEDAQLLETCAALEEKCLSSEEAIKELIKGSIENYAWNKIYKRELFETVQYPVGKLWEDIGTTYLLIDKCDRIYISNRITYNYRIRNNSITGMHSYKADMDIYTQRKEQYDFLKEKYPHIANEAMESLAHSAIQAYIHAPVLSEYYDFRKDVGDFLINQKSEILKLKSYSIKHRLFYLNPGLFRDLSSIILRIKRPKKKRKATLRLAKRVQNKLNGIIDRVRKSKDVRNLWKEGYSKRIYLIGTPDHDNLGDHAIALSTIQILEEQRPEYQVIDITETDYWYYRDSIHKYCNPQSDFIVLQGGGNFGNQYPYIEKIRRDAVRTINVPHILFPQTMYFIDNNDSKKELSSACFIYGKASNNVIFYAREKYSFYLMKEAFPSRPVYLLPDIVLRYRFPKYEAKREDILLCLRNDKESALSISDKSAIKEKCLPFGNIRYTDTCVKDYIRKENREAVVRQKLEQFARAEMIVTDRLHGMVFAALTNTPCVVLSNYNHKIIGVYDWIKTLPYICFAKNVDEIPSRLKELKDLNGEGRYDYSVFDEQLEERIVNDFT